MLTGKYRTGVPSDSRAASEHLGPFVAPLLGAAPRRVVDAVVTAADGLGASPGTVALGWLVAQPALSCAVVGPRTAAQLEALADGWRFALPAEIGVVLDEVSDPGHP